MNRFHVHVAVEDLEANIRFYSAVFGAEPAVKQEDYAKWMLEDPRINFAISNRGHEEGINHLGIQVESDDELDAMRLRLADAAISATAPGEAACCYARSNKYWTTDPQGVAWETYHSLGTIAVFGEDDRGGSAGVSEADDQTPAAGKSPPNPVAAQSKACCAK
ncbi:MAG: ArsI/CadI family heavy metal resistance metalloenzyme [Burkholderiales bacterium]